MFYAVSLLLVVIVQIECKPLLTEVHSLKTKSDQDTVVNVDSQNDYLKDEATVYLNPDGALAENNSSYVNSNKSVDESDVRKSKFEEHDIKEIKTVNGLIAEASNDRNGNRSNNNESKSPTNLEEIEPNILEGDEIEHDTSVEQSISDLPKIKLTNENFNIDEGLEGEEVTKCSRSADTVFVEVPVDGGYGCCNVPVYGRVNLACHFGSEPYSNPTSCEYQFDETCGPSYYEPTYVVANGPFEPPYGPQCYVPPCDPWYGPPPMPPYYPPPGMHYGPPIGPSYDSSFRPPCGPSCGPPPEVQYGSSYWPPCGPPYEPPCEPLYGPPCGPPYGQQYVSSYWPTCGPPYGPPFAAPYGPPCWPQSGAYEPPCELPYDPAYGPTCGSMYGPPPYGVPFYEPYGPPCEPPYNPAYGPTFGPPYWPPFEPPCGSQCGPNYVPPCGPYMPPPNDASCCRTVVGKVQLAAHFGP